MGYRDDLIAWLKDGNGWEELTNDEREKYASLSDDDARTYLVLRDQFDMGDISPVAKIVPKILEKLIALFPGAMVTPASARAGKLSKGGRLLAKAVIEFRRCGMSDEEIAKGLQGMDAFLIAMLLTLHGGPSDESTTDGEN